MYCSQCGKDNQSDAKFCGLCGNLLVISGDSLEPEYVRKNEQEFHAAAKQTEKSNVNDLLCKWNWGAFSLTWIWGLVNRSYKPFLAFIPIFGLFYVFVCGKNGNRWAWENRKWDSAEDYRKSIRLWNQWGIGLFAANVILAVVCVATVAGGAYDMDIPVDGGVLPSIFNSAESDEVQAIKALRVEGSNHTLGELIDAGVGNPVYELYDPAEDGNRYVTITGDMNYNEEPMRLALQYKDMGSDRYEFHTLTYNELPQDQYETVSFFEYLVSTYNQGPPTAPALVSNETAGAESDMVTYTNSRYGFAVSFPKHWGTVSESDNGDGGVLFSNGGIEVRAFAATMMESSLEEYIAEYYPDCEYSNTVVPGADVAYDIWLPGEIYYQTMVLAVKDGVVYGCMETKDLMDETYDESQKASLEKEIQSVQDSFRVN